MAKKASTKPAAAQASTEEAIAHKGTATIYKMSPADIIANPEDNGRLEEHTEENIASMARSMKSNGQIHPVIIRANPEGGKPVLVTGFRRHAAALKLMEKNPDFTLDAVFRTFDDDKASFLSNIAENADRTDTTPFDDAANIERLIAPISEGGFGMSQVDAAKAMGKSAPWVSQTLSLTKLPAYVQEAAIKKGISMPAARLLIDAPEELVEEFVKPNSKLVTERQIKERKDALTEKAAEEGDAKPETAETTTLTASGKVGKKRGRKPGPKLITPKQVKAHIHKLVEENEQISFLYQYGFIFNKLMHGQLTPDGFNRRLIDLVETFGGDENAVMAAPIKPEKEEKPKAAKKKAAKKKSSKKVSKKAAKKTSKDEPTDADLDEIEFDGGDDAMMEESED